MNKRELKVNYHWERGYPHFVAVIIVIIVYWVFKEKEIHGFENFTSALSSVLTITSLIIGFLGAVMPVIISMKNDSKIVKYIFEKDENQLFLKYIKSTILIGLITSGLSIFMFFISELENIGIKNMITYIWIFLVSEFFLLTYRCLDKMVRIIFIKDKDDNEPNFNNNDKYEDLTSHYNNSSKN
jgi:hypothetical protein